MWRHGGSPQGQRVRNSRSRMRVAWTVALGGARLSRRHVTRACVHVACLLGCELCGRSRIGPIQPIPQPRVPPCCSQQPLPNTAACYPKAPIASQTLHRNCTAASHLPSISPLATASSLQASSGLFDCGDTPDESEPLAALRDSAEERFQEMAEYRPAPEANTQISLVSRPSAFCPSFCPSFCP